METAKNIYELELHETVTLLDYSVMRVPGGWIYHYLHNDVVMIFVPFNNEFQYSNTPQPPKNRMMEEIYIKLTITHDHSQLHYEWFDNLQSLALFIWHLGLKDQYAIVSCEQVTKEVYEENYLPF